MRPAKVAQASSLPWFWFANWKLAQPLLAVLALLCAACRPDMGTQPRYEPYQASNFFPNGAAMRPIPPHTVPRGTFDPQSLIASGVKDGRVVAKFPLPVTAELIARGRERFNIYCSVCHGLTGSADGMIVQRGFPAPPSFHSQRLREAPIGHFVDVISNGYGVMFPYAARVAPPDRWAIAAYIRALQLSENAVLSDAPEPIRKKLEAEKR